MTEKQLMIDVTIKVFITQAAWDERNDDQLEEDIERIQTNVIDAIVVLAEDRTRELGGEFTVEVET